MDASHKTILQVEELVALASSVVFEMLRAAIALGAAVHVLPPRETALVAASTARVGANASASLTLRLTVRNVTFECTQFWRRFARFTPARLNHWRRGRANVFVRGAIARIPARRYHRFIQLAALR